MSKRIEEIIAFLEDDLHIVQADNETINIHGHELCDNTCGCYPTCQSLPEGSTLEYGEFIEDPFILDDGEQGFPSGK